MAYSVCFKPRQTITYDAHVDENINGIIIFEIHRRSSVLDKRHKPQRNMENSFQQPHFLRAHLSSDSPFFVGCLKQKEEAKNFGPRPTTGKIFHRNFISQNRSSIMQKSYQTILFFCLWPQDKTNCSAIKEGKEKPRNENKGAANVRDENFQPRGFRASKKLFICAINYASADQINCAKKRKKNKSETEQSTKNENWSRSCNISSSNEKKRVGRG